MKFSQEDIKNLIIKIRKNDNESLLELIDKFKPYIATLTKRYNIKSDYDDILSELLEIIIFIDLNKNNLNGYIRKCLRNYCLKIMKNNKSYVTFDERLDYFIFSKDYFEDVLDRDFNKDNLILELVKVLNNEEREVFLSIYLNDISINDLVKIFKKSKATIYRILNVSRGKVKEYLKRRY